MNCCCPDHGPGLAFDYELAVVQAYGIPNFFPSWVEDDGKTLRYKTHTWTAEGTESYSKTNKFTWNGVTTETNKTREQSISAEFVRSCGEEVGLKSFVTWELAAAWSQDMGVRTDWEPGEEAENKSKYHRKQTSGTPPDPLDTDYDETDDRTIAAPYSYGSWVTAGIFPAPTVTTDPATRSYAAEYSETFNSPPPSADSGSAGGNYEYLDQYTGQVDMDTLMETQEASMPTVTAPDPDLIDFGAHPYHRTLLSDNGPHIDTRVLGSVPSAPRLARQCWWRIAAMDHRGGPLLVEWAVVEIPEVGPTTVTRHREMLIFKRDSSAPSTVSYSAIRTLAPPAARGRVKLTSLRLVQALS